MKKCVELQVATKPRSSSISASSAPASIAWMQARMQLSLECELSFWSCSAGPVRRICTVNRLRPRASISGLRQLPFGNDDDRRAADRQARILIGRALDAARHHQADMHALAHAVGLDHVEQPRRERVAGRGRCRCAASSRRPTGGRDACRGRRCARRSAAGPPRRRRRARSRNRTPRPSPRGAGSRTPLTLMRTASLRGSPT